LSAELLYLFVVLAAGVATAWWAGHRFTTDLSAITSIAQLLRLEENTAATRSVASAPTVADAPSSRAQAAPTGAPYCQPGQEPSFANGMAALEQALGDVMGKPVECEHAASAGGDTVQQTSTGLAAYDSASNTVTFTDGWRHWALTPGGVVSWEGTDSLPPAADPPNDPGAE
jgi:hypothetical protein